LGHEVIVADPNFAPMYAARSRKIKTDRRDARALAEACRLGAYRPAHRLSEAQRHVRGRLTVRDALVRTRTGYISVIRARLRQDGWRVPTGSAEGFIRRVLALRVPGRLLSELAPLLAVMRQVNQQLAYSDARIAAVARTDERVARLQTVPSVGPVTAAAFVAALDDAGLSRLETASIRLFASLALAEGGGGAPTSVAATGIATHDFRRGRGLLNLPAAGVAASAPACPLTPKAEAGSRPVPWMGPARGPAGMCQAGRWERSAGQARGRGPASSSAAIGGQVSMYASGSDGGRGIVSGIDTMETWRPTADTTAESPNRGVIRSDRSTTCERDGILAKDSVFTTYVRTVVLLGERTVRWR
jgi:hypothetical protein